MNNTVGIENNEKIEESIKYDDEIKSKIKKTIKIVN